MKLFSLVLIGVLMIFFISFSEVVSLVYGINLQFVKDVIEYMFVFQLDFFLLVFFSSISFVLVDLEGEFFGIFGVVGGYMVIDIIDIIILLVFLKELVLGFFFED